MIGPVRIIPGDVLDGLAQIPAGSVQCCVTSPPYWGLRDYGVEGQIGLEPTPEAFVAKMVEVFAAVRRVLRDDGTLWLNLGDCYAGSGRGGYAGTESTLEGYTGSQDEARKAKKRLGSQKPTELHARTIEAGAIGRAWTPAPRGLKQKDLCMVPWRVALALQADGWYLRSVIVWHKRSPMPESVTDRPTSAWEPIFLLSKSDRYFYDAEAVKEASATGAWDAMPPNGGVKHAGNNGNATYSGDQPANNGTRNQRNVWTLSAEPYSEAHFATFPSEIPRRAILAGTSEKGACPACGAPWTRVVERTGEIDPSAKGSRFDVGKTAGRTGGDRAQAGERLLKKSAGWQHGCACAACEPVPCVVLDPFLGSGTTIAVARQLGRHGVGCELNPDYVELAKVRIGKAERPHTFQDTREKAEGGLFVRPVGIDIED